MREILKLNANFFPLSTGQWKDVMVAMVSGSTFPLDIEYEMDEHGTIDRSKIASFEMIKDFDKWMELPVRPYDEYVTTSKRRIRLPTVVVCGNYKQIPKKRQEFATKSNIWKRDDYTCGYSGKKLSREELSVDHIMPVSRVGKNTWENLITCDKELNRIKGNRTPREAGMKLLWQPYRPKNGLDYSFVDQKEWEAFIGGGEFDYTNNH